MSMEFFQCIQQAQQAFVDNLTKQLTQQESHKFHSPFDPDFFAFAKKIVENPQKIADAQAAYAQAYLALCQKRQNNGEENTKDIAEKEALKGDKRFRDPEWETNPWFDFIKKAYLLHCEHTQSLTKEIAGEEDSQFSHKINFYTQQWLNTLSPTHFIFTNPCILRTILETGGENLMQGLRHFLADVKKSHGMLKVSNTDLNYFSVGENLAITPGKVIYQNEIMQLIQYAPTTPKVRENPLLIIPPWINKYYILDLQPENSWVKWLVDQGYTVFLISWVNPMDHASNKGLSDYLQQGPVCALEVIAKIVGQLKVNVVGYCVGGTLLAVMLAYFAAKKIDSVKSATFLTTLLDFSTPGDLGVFIDEYQLTLIENQMQEKGYLEGNIMTAVFNSLRANELIWNYFVHHYLEGKKPLPFDLLYWNADPMNLPEKLHRYYLREMYLKNQLVKPGGVIIDGVPLDLKKTKMSSFFLAAKEDHIVPWIASYQGMQYLSGSKQFVLAGSGHVAGVINPPHKNKYGYWVNSKRPKKSSDWLEGALYQPGSWWQAWVAWVKPRAGRLIPARHLENSPFTPIEDAPGHYVKVRCDPPKE